MATKTNVGSTSVPGFEDAADRIRELNEKMIAAAKQNGKIALDAYEKSLQALVEFEEKVANASQLDWVAAIAKAHATFMTDVSAAFTSATRDALK